MPPGTFEMPVLDGIHITWSLQLQNIVKKKTTKNQNKTMKQPKEKIYIKG